MYYNINYIVYRGYSTKQTVKNVQFFFDNFVFEISYKGNNLIKTPYTRCFLFFEFVETINKSNLTYSDEYFVITY